jgi:hypothetical protein
VPATHGSKHTQNEDDDSNRTNETKTHQEHCTPVTSRNNSLLQMGTKDTEMTSRKGRKKNEITPLLPSEIVCTTSDLTSSKHSMEFAVILSLMVVGMYLYGFYEAALSLPDIATGFHVGRNLNIARLESDGGIVAAVAAAHVQQQNLRAAPNDEDSFPDNQQQQQEEEKPPSLPAGQVAIPEGIWPVSIRDEVDDLEEILHVGDMKTVMKVPKFWAPPLHNRQFFTREQAMKVGTCVEPDPVTGSHVRGDQCPPSQRTIFIGLASYRDYQCRFTLESAFLRAEHPERIRVGECVCITMSAVLGCGFCWTISDIV